MCDKTGAKILCVGLVSVLVGFFVGSIIAKILLFLLGTVISIVGISSLEEDTSEVITFTISAFLIGALVAIISYCFYSVGVFSGVAIAVLIISSLISLCGAGFTVFFIYNIFTASNSSSNSESSKSTVKENIEYEEIKKRREAFLNQKRVEFSNELSSIPRVRIEKSDDKIKRQLVSDMPEIHFSNITRSTVLEKIFPLVCIDVETTGIQVRGNDIVEVSAIKYDVGFKPISCFTTLLKPRKSIPPEASQVNNITDDMVKDSPSFSSIAVAFSDYISGCNIVGHNVMFDLRFLFVSGATLPSKVRYFDTLDLAKKTLKVYGKKKYDYHNNEYVEDDEYDVYDYKLETLCDYYDIHRDDAHRSLSDCLATVKVFERIIDDKTY